MNCSSGHFEHTNVVASLSQLNYVSAVLRSANPLFVFAEFDACGWVLESVFFFGLSLQQY